MREGDVVVLPDGIAGTLVQSAMGKAWVLTKALFIRIEDLKKLSPIQEGQLTVEEADTDRFEPKRRKHGRTE